MEYDSIIAEVAECVGVPKAQVDKIYKAFWRAVKEHIESLPLKENLTEGEFFKLQPNVNIPSLGKLHVTWKRYSGVKKQFEYQKNKLIRKDKDNATTD